MIYPYTLCCNPAHDLTCPPSYINLKHLRAELSSLEGDHAEAVAATGRARAQSRASIAGAEMKTLAAEAQRVAAEETAREAHAERRAATTASSRRAEEVR